MVFSQFRAVLMSYYRRPVVCLCVAVYCLWWVLFGYECYAFRRGWIAAPRKHYDGGAGARFEFNANRTWDRLSLHGDSGGTWSIEELKLNQIPQRITSLDASELLADPKERLEICGQEAWPDDNTPAGEKLLAFYEDVFSRLWRYPNLKQIALPPIRLTGKFAAMSEKLPRVKTLVFTYCAVLPDGWTSIARLRGVKQVEFIGSILWPGLGELSKLEELRILTLSRCEERDGFVLDEIDLITQVTEFRIGTIQFHKPPVKSNVIDFNEVLFFQMYPSHTEPAYGIDLPKRLRELKTKAAVRLLPAGHEPQSIFEVESYQRVVSSDPRFRPGFVNLFAFPGLERTLIACGILTLLTAFHLFGQLATPLAWLAPGVVRCHLIGIIGLWVFHTLAMVFYGKHWGTDPWAVVAVQLLIPGIWGTCYLATCETDYLGPSLSAVLWAIMMGSSACLLCLPIFLNFIPSMVEFASGENPSFVMGAVIIGLFFCGYVFGQLRTFPRTIANAGAGEFPLSVSLTEIQTFQQHRMAYLKEPLFSRLFNPDMLGELLPSAFWHSAHVRTEKWSAPIPFTIQQSLFYYLVFVTLGLAFAISGVLVMGVDPNLSSLLLPSKISRYFFDAPWMVGVMLYVFWLRRSQMTSWEILRPISREELGATYAKSLAAQFWPLAVWSLLTTIILFVVDRSPFSLWANWPAWMLPIFLVVIASGWLVLWACLVAVLASSGWWRRTLIAFLGGAGLFGMLAIVIFSFPNHTQPPVLVFSSSAFVGCCGTLLLAVGLFVFFRRYASHQWLTKEFTEG